jgi:hypothetical protein
LAQVCGFGAKLAAPNATDAARLSNALIESFVVHLRNVTNFLYLDKPKATDVVAADSFDPGVWTSLRPAISATLKNARVRANKEVAHLTTDRISGSPPRKAWDFGGLGTEMRSLTRLFVKNALASRLASEVAAVIR